MRQRLLSVFATVVVICAALPACRSTTWNARFTPTPAETFVGPGGDTAPLARVLLSIRGAERPAEDLDADFEMRVRLRIENSTQGPLEVDLGAFLLLDANLEAFGTPRLDTPEGASDTFTVSPGEPALVDLMFPFPEGLEPEGLHLEGLNLRGTIRSDGTDYPWGFTFTRAPRVIYGDPWYGYGRYYGPWSGPRYGDYRHYGHRW